MDRDARRCLPPVSAVMEHSILADWVQSRGRAAVRQAVRQATAESRSAVLRGERVTGDVADIAGRARAILSRDSRWLRRVINATGVMLHTGLGRAPLADEAIEAVATAASGYCNLEFDLDHGTRGRRTTGVARLLRELTGAPAATAVNNNAGATVLALRALARGREVIVSRGQLIEIGGSFRLPEIFEVSGARLREVGTTNKTRLADYASAIGPDTAAILRVHPSNFRIVGFTEQPALGELARLAHDRGLWAIDDIGSGALGPVRPPHAFDDPTASAGIADGADLVLFSGDKLLGGPQCGILIGSESAIQLIESDPLMRALRLDKMTLAALEATLELALDPARANRRIPLWAMMAEPLERLTARASDLAAALRSQLDLNASVLSSESFVGGGAAPDRAIPTATVAVSPPFPGSSGSAAAFAAALRGGDLPVATRLHRGLLIFDIRTVLENQDTLLLDAVHKVCHDRGAGMGSNGPTDTVDMLDDGGDFPITGLEKDERR